MPVSRRTFLLSVPVSVGAAGLAAPALLRPRANALAQPVTAPMYRGVNLSGAEFTPDAAHLPGVVNRDYRYPTRDDLRYVAGRGHRMVRLPIRWERVQPVLMAPLQPAELQRLLSTVDQAAATGLKVLVDLHNYARYIRSTDEGGSTLVLGDGRLTDAHLVDLWSRLSTALKGRAGVLGYGLMNEPHDLPGAPGSAATSRTVWSFEDGLGPWSGEADATATISTTAGTVHEGRSSLRVSRRLPAGRQYIRVNDNANNTLAPTGGRTLSVAVLTPRDAPGTGWAAQLEMQDWDYRWRPGPSFPLTPGRWTTISCTPDAATWSQHRGVGVQFSSDQSSAVTAEAYLDTVRQHSPASAPLSEAQQWERTTQLCVDIIRANQDPTPVYVSGIGYSGAQTWPQHHPEPWVGDPTGSVVYEAHYYGDRGNTGTYRHRFAEEDTDARSRGFASLQARTTIEISRFLDWCRTHQVQGFIGELGWDRSRDAAQWNSVGNALYAALDAAGVGAAHWAAGQWFGSSYNLSVYTGAPLSRRAAPARVVEAHPSRNI